MADILNTTWPVNVIEQQAFMTRLDKKVKDVERRSAQVILKQADEPTQKQWEDAYFEQTGFPAPITPGTKLIWLSYYTGKLKVYTTVKDAEGGLVSTGTVRPYISNPKPRSPFRLLGNIVNGRLLNGYMDYDLRKDMYTDIDIGVATSLLINPKLWAERKLASLMFIFSARSEALTSAEAPALSFGFNLENGSSEYMWFETELYRVSGYNEDGAGGYAYFNNAANAAQGEYTLFNEGFPYTNTRCQWIGKVANSSDPAYCYTEGMIHMSGFDWIRDDSGKYRAIRAGSTMIHGFGTHIDTSIATNNLYFWNGAAAFLTPMAIRNGVPAMLSNDTTTTSDGYNFSNYGSMYGSIYGWFSDEGTPQDLGDI